MKLKRRERVGVLVLLMAVIALAVDQFLLPTPTAADAATEDDPVADVDPPLVALEPPPAHVRPANASSPVPDVFDVTRLSLQGAAGGPPTDPESVSAEEFRKRYELTATLLGPKPVALVADRALRVGDQLDGFTLDAIEDSQAVFVSGEVRVVLRVMAPGGKN